MRRFLRCVIRGIPRTSREFEQRLGRSPCRWTVSGLSRLRYWRLDSGTPHPIACGRMKPTYGRVSRYGVVPLSWSLDHAGPMARNVEDCAILLQAIAGYDPKDPASADVPVPDFRDALKNGIKGLRVGVPRANWFNENKGTDPETESNLQHRPENTGRPRSDCLEIDGQPFSLAVKPTKQFLRLRPTLITKNDFRKRQRNSAVLYVDGCSKAPF